MDGHEFIWNPGPWPRRHGAIVFGTGGGFATEYIGSGYSTYSSTGIYQQGLEQYRGRGQMHERKVAEWCRFYANKTQLKHAILVLHTYQLTYSVCTECMYYPRWWYGVHRASVAWPQSGWHCDAAVGSTDSLLEPLPGTPYPSLQNNNMYIPDCISTQPDVDFRSHEPERCSSITCNPIIDPFQLQSGRPGLILLTNWFGYVLERVIASGPLITRDGIALVTHWA